MVTSKLRSNLCETCSVAYAYVSGRKLPEVSRTMKSQKGAMAVNLI